MKPGEIITKQNSDINLNGERQSITLKVANSGDRPIQVGSHYHFAEANSALIFDRVIARGHRLNVAAGTAVRFEPGQSKEINLVPFSGNEKVYGFNQAIMGDL